ESTRVGFVHRHLSILGDPRRSQAHGSFSRAFRFHDRFLHRRLGHDGIAEQGDADRVRIRAVVLQQRIVVLVDEKVAGCPGYERGGGGGGGGGGCPPPTPRPAFPPPPRGSH